MVMCKSALSRLNSSSLICDCPQAVEPRDPRVYAREWVVGWGAARSFHAENHTSTRRWIQDRRLASEYQWSPELLRRL